MGCDLLLPPPRPWQLPSAWELGQWPVQVHIAVRLLHQLLWPPAAEREGRMKLLLLQAWVLVRSTGGHVPAGRKRNTGFLSHC